MTKSVIQEYIPHASSLIYGCMGIGGGWDSSPVTQTHIQQADTVIHTALEQGINFFDHADIYTLGKAEHAFGQALKNTPHLRDKMVLQSKCGIRFDDEHGPKRYDLSYDWIMYSVEQSLKRLCTDNLDILLLHRPDPLMEPEDIARAFSDLKQQGKVNYFGVSNMHSHQIAAIQSTLDLPLVANQMELHLAQTRFIDETLFAGHPQAPHNNYSLGLLDYCKQHRIQLQSWGSLSQGLYLGNDSVIDSYLALPGHTANSIKHTQQCVHHLSEKYAVSKEAILLAWLMKQPLGITPVIGTTQPKRIQACQQAYAVSLTREDWYALYVSARGEELP